MIPYLLWRIFVISFLWFSERYSFMKVYNCQDLNFFPFFLRFVGMSRRPDSTEELKRLKCTTLIFVGDISPFHLEALHMTGKLDRRYSALVEMWKQMSAWKIMVAVGMIKLLTSLHARIRFVREFCRRVWHEN